MDKFIIRKRFRGILIFGCDIKYFPTQLPFGSIFGSFRDVMLTQYSEEGDTVLKFRNNGLTSLGLKIIGVPHIGLRLRASKIMNDTDSAIHLLDAGFGTGAYSFSLSKKIKQINAIDKEKEKIEYARSVNHFNNISFDIMDLTSLKFHDESFDLIICSDVIEHIKDDKTAFSELARVLKKGGFILLTVPYNSSDNIKSSYENLGHERPGYSKDSIETLCNRNDLRIVKVETYSYGIAGKILHMNYSLVEHRILLGILFYPLYSIALVTDSIFKVGQPSGIYYKISKGK